MIHTRLFLVFCMAVMLSSCGLKRDLVLPKDAQKQPVQVQVVSPAANTTPAAQTDTLAPATSPSPESH